MKLDDRKKRLLKLTVENHIKDGSPVGSTFLVDSGDLDVSGATVRNEMRELEEGGLVAQPHTSAGRIPTEQGYRYYVKHMMKPEQIKSDKQEEFEKLISDEENKGIKDAAKETSKEVNAAVLVSFNLDNVYYTGLSRLFSHPEFEDYDYTLYISQIFDHCEEYISTIKETVKDGEVRVLIGKNNPLGNRCSLVASNIDDDKLFMCLGPVRMNYSSAVSYTDLIQKLTN